MGAEQKVRFKKYLREVAAELGVPDEESTLVQLQENILSCLRGQTEKRIVTRVGDRTRLAVIVLRSDHPDSVSQFVSNGWTHIISMVDVVKTPPKEGERFEKKDPGPFVFHVFER